MPLSEYIPKIKYPDDNPVNDSIAKFGEILFFDKNLSLDSTISCASCHISKFGLADTIKFSKGVGDSLGFRNASTLLNVAYQPYLFADGGVPNLELQILAPLSDEKEMHLPIIEGVKRLEKNKEYNRLSKKFFNRTIDPYVITRAIANYERTLINFDTKYDRFIRGDTAILTTEEKLGMKLFFSEKTNCSSCHQAPLFTNFSFENIGFERREDLGRMRITGDSSDLGKFKVPTLRNIKNTGPYFYDGSESELEGVIEFFNNGGGNHFNKSKIIKPLNLTKKEKQELLSFLKIL